MRSLRYLADLTWLSLVIAPIVVSSAVAQVSSRAVSTDVCSVLKEPETFVNQVIRLRGLVYLGEDHMNISDRACPGRGIELVVKSDQVHKQKDVHYFYIQLNHQGRKGIATITGVLQSDSNPVTPYVLNIQHVADVTPRD
jgi:hypothetical protein